MRRYIPVKLRREKASLDEREKVFRTVLDNPASQTPTALENARRGLKNVQKERTALDKEIADYKASKQQAHETFTVSCPSTSPNPRAIDGDIARLDDVGLSVAIHFASLMCKLNGMEPPAAPLEQAAWGLRLEGLEWAAAARWGIDWVPIYRRLYDFEGSRRR